ncbi:MAG: DNA polymerase III subunit delta [Chitinophagaceae bacterium]
MKRVTELIKQIEKGDVKPIYVLDGEEPFYIDQIIHFFENNFLQEHERDFNQSIFYGKDSDYVQIVNECRSYPVFASRRLVILKEAAQLKEFNKLESYLESPSDSTVFVIAYKYKKLDGRSKLKKAVEKNGTYLSFEKIKDNLIPDWILQYCQQKKIKINAANADLLAAYLGTDLHKIVNEIDKVLINIKEGEEIKAEHIEKYIGISKDYNVFEFPKTIFDRQHEKAFKIANYFIQNEKDHPMVVITAMLYAELNKIYRFHFVQNLSPQEQAAKAKIPPFVIRDYNRYARNFPLQKTIQAIQIVQQYNLQAIGIDSANNNPTLLKELTSKLLQL